jgi:hypothetical protein
MRSDASFDPCPASVAEHIAELVAKRKDLPDAGVLTDLLDSQIETAVSELLEAEPATLSDALALSWIARSGLTQYAQDAESGNIENFSGLDTAYRALVRLDGLLERLGASRTFAAALDDGPEAN